MRNDFAPEWRRVRVASIRELATDIRGYELVPADGRALPTYEAGAHVDIHVPTGLIRQYSLCGKHNATDCYRIAVKKDVAGRGGSISMHDDVDVGSVLAMTVPRNHFPLATDASASLLIAGGIGITPIYAMVQSLHVEDRNWTLHYCARSRAHAAFYDELKALAPQRVIPHFSDVRVLDVEALVAASTQDMHVYCCGPERLMSAVKTATVRWDPSRVHFEWFSAPEIDHTLDHSFEVKLERSGLELTVPAGRSILQIVREHGIDVPSACEEGVCGTCETGVLAGDPDHRDMLLTPAERAANRSMMICISRAKSNRIVLDL
jgi:vanillate O-demethylase ferredoxin subunit